MSETPKFQIVRRNVINGKVTTCQSDLGSLLQEYPDLSQVAYLNGLRQITFEHYHGSPLGSCEVTVIPMGRVSFEAD